MVAWNPGSFSLDIIAMTSQLVHCKVLARQGTNEFYYTFLYAMNDSQGRRIAWKDLEELAKGITGPWLLSEDFNCVMNVSERKLCVCMNVYGLQDMSSTGCLFTWKN